MTLHSERFSGVKSLLNFSSIIVVILINTFIPILVAREDEWDGSIIDYGVSTGDLRGIRHWFFSAGVEFQYFFILLQSKFVSIFNIEFRILNQILTVIFLSVLIRETYLLANRYVGNSHVSSLLACLIFALFPTWGLLVSSVLTFYIFSFALAAFGTRKYFESSSKVKESFSIALILVSLNYGSMTLYSLFLYIFLSINTRAKRRIFYQDKKFFVLAIVIVVFFLIQKIINPGTGEYENYNDILNLQIFSDWVKFGTSVKHFLTFLLFPLAASLISLLIWLFAQRFEKANSGIQFSKENYRKFASIILLFCASSFPYCAVGKSAHFLFLSSWSGRHGFVVSQSVALLTVLPFTILAKHIHRKLFNKVVTVFLFLILATECILLNRNFTDKYFRGYLVSSIQITLSQDQIFVPPGKLQVVLKNLPEGFLFRDYEANYISWKSFGNSNHYTSITRDFIQDFKIPSDILENGNQAVKYIFTPPPVVCSSEIILRAPIFQKKSTWIAYALIIDSRDPLKIDSLQTICP